MLDFLKNKLEEFGKKEDRDRSQDIYKKSIEIIQRLSGRGEVHSRKLADNCLVFSNASGGTGVSTVVANMAYKMAVKGLRVIIVDMNIICPSQGILNGIDNDIDDENDLVAFLTGSKTLSNCIKRKNKVDVFFASNRSLIDEINCNEKAAIANAETMISTLKQYYDVVLIDCPMRINSLLENTILYNAEQIYLVWDENITSITNTEKIKGSMLISGINYGSKLRVIMNKRTSVHYSEFPLRKLGLELVGVLPFDPDIIDNALKGRVFCESGVSTGKNSVTFDKKMGDITDKVLSICGYIEDDVVSADEDEADILIDDSEPSNDNSTEENSVEAVEDIAEEAEDAIEAVEDTAEEVEDITPDVIDDTDEVIENTQPNDILDTDTQVFDNEQLTKENSRIEEEIREMYLDSNKDNN